jgi:hypothetical protein
VPQLYKNPLYDSPTRANPGDPFLIPGSNFAKNAAVMYQLTPDPTLAPITPTSFPFGQTRTTGTIAPTHIDDNGLQIILPPVMQPGGIYTLWVGNPNVACANIFGNDSIMINDPRPLWLSPPPTSAKDVNNNGQVSPYPYLYTTGVRPGFANREVKIIGRNLNAIPGSTAQVKLVGPHNTSYQMTPIVDPSPIMNEFVARIPLPDPMPAGDYTIMYKRSNNPNIGWTTGPTPLRLNIRTRPSHTVQFSVANYASAPDNLSCNGDGTEDNFRCITRAINDAKLYVVAHPDQSADVLFPAGTWVVKSSCWTKAGTNNYPPISDTYVSSQGTSVSYIPCLPMGLVPTGSGIIVPKNVNLVGATPVPGGNFIATIATTIGFTQPYLDSVADNHSGIPAGVDPTLNPIPKDMPALFGLRGNNVIHNLRFTAFDSFSVPVATPDPTQPIYDDKNNVIGVYPYGPITTPSSGALVLAGGDDVLSGPSANGYNITITNNFFDNTYQSIQPGQSYADPTSALAHSAQLPLFRNLVITHNTFASYKGPSPGIVEESVVAHNIFYPGAVADPIALGVSGSRHADISNNTIRGDIHTYSTNAFTDPTKYGFRAGMFFPLQTPHEHTVIAGNTMHCIGTVGGFDGEAISIDSNLDLAGFESGKYAINAGANTVTVSALPGQSPNSTPLTTSSLQALLLGATNDTSGYLDRWLRIDDGPGLGQSRKITAVTYEPATRNITFTVTPHFDVTPVIQRSRIIVSNQVWHMYILNNRIDNNPTLCPLSKQFTNATYKPYNGGLIGTYGAAANIIIAGNKQFNTPGIGTWVQYGLANPSSFQANFYFGEIRDNVIDGAFNSNGNTMDPANIPGGGINLGGAVYDYTDQAKATGTSLGGYPGFGVSISYNTITNTALSNQNVFNGKSTAQAIQTIQGGSWSLQTADPGYLATLVFKNTVSSLPKPWRTNEQDYTIAFSNGEQSLYGRVVGADSKNHPNYPKNTLVCGNIFGRTVPAAGAPPGPTPGPIQDAPPQFFSNRPYPSTLITPTCDGSFVQ